MVSKRKIKKYSKAERQAVTHAIREYALGYVNYERKQRDKNLMPQSLHIWFYTVQMASLGCSERPHISTVYAELEVLRENPVSYLRKQSRNINRGRRPTFTGKNFVY